MSTDRTILISKSLSYILRHQAVKEHIAITQDGWVKVSDILQWKGLKRLRTTLDDLRQVVASNDKQRYTMAEIPELHALCIRANQGHSIPFV